VIIAKMARITKTMISNIVVGYILVAGYESSS
jgi:hypothetical protein